MLTLDHIAQQDALFSSTETNDKVKFQLLLHAYKQLAASQFASFLCATIIFIGLYHNPHYSSLLMWYGVFLVIIIARLFLLRSFFKDTKAEKNYSYWKTLFFIGTIAGGICWGAEGVFLFPYADPYQKTLCILILAGITAGSVASLGAVLHCAITFLILAIGPFIVSILFLQNYNLLLYDITLTIYLFYMIALARNSNHMIHNVTLLKYKNDTLLEALSKANLELAQLATHDALTHIENSYLFNINLANAVNRANRDNTQLAILYIDIDNFKAINDTYGHPVGDLLLKEVAALLKSILRDTDIIARLGGDEFVVVLEKIERRTDVENIARYICKEIKQPFKINDIVIQVTVSIGISIYPDNGVSKEALLKQADHAMYHVKRQGKNDYYFMV